MHQSEIAELMRTLTTGIYGIGVHHLGVHRIFTASWVMPVSFDPVLIALSVNPLHRSYQILTQNGSFSINVIGQKNADLAEKLSAPGDRLQGLQWRAGSLGAPLLDLAIAHLECRVVHEYPAGDHHLIVGKLVGGSLRDPQGVPLIYAETGNLDGAVTLFPQAL